MGTQTGPFATTAWVDDRPELLSPRDVSVNPGITTSFGKLIFVVASALMILVATTLLLGVTLGLLARVFMAGWRHGF